MTTPLPAHLRSMHKLTWRHEKFAMAYVANGGKAGEAYREVRPDAPDLTDDYCRLRGNELVRYPLIAKRIKELRQEALDRNAVTVDRLIEELAFIALSDIRNIAEFDGKSLRVKSFKGMSDAAARTICEISDGKDGPRIKMWSKLEAMNQLLKVLGVADRKEITGRDGKDLFPVEKMTDLEMARLLAYQLGKGDSQARGTLKAIEHDEASEDG